MPIDDLTALGQKMREARKNKELTQQELSDLSHVSVKQIANIEKGKMNPSYLILRALAKVLHNLFRYAYKSRYFSGRWRCQSDENALFQLSARNAWHPAASHPGNGERTDRVVQKIWNELSQWVKFNDSLTGSFHFRRKEASNACVNTHRPAEKKIPPWFSSPLACWGQRPQAPLNTEFHSVAARSPFHSGRH